jgi:hypothetical protein
MNRLLALFVVVECEKYSNAELGNLSPQPILMMQANNPPRANLMQQGDCHDFSEDEKKAPLFERKTTKMTKRPRKKSKGKQNKNRRNAVDAEGMCAGHIMSL